MRLSLRTPEECRSSLSKLANAAANQKIEPKYVNAAAYCISQVLSSIRIDSQEQRIRQLEALIEEIEEGRRS